ncbi:MAG: Eco57I restriction-modification methylase domain-containing protein [Ruminococcus flavefaciens]|nr:Eco57I restriction-modification methylase domain-containing protein [Ruminococcus flavefaciens]
MSRKLETFEKVLTEPYDNHSFVNFIRELLNNIDLVAPNLYNKIYNNFSYYVDGYYHIGNYTGADGNKIAVFSVALKKGDSVERARTMQRNFVKPLLEQGMCAGALVAFYTPEEPEKWRLSFIRLDYEFSKGKVTEKITPAKRYSYLVGKGEPCNTAKQRLFPIFDDDNSIPGIDELEEAFSVEKVTNEFFQLYCEKYHELREFLDSNDDFVQEAKIRNFTSEQFAKKLLGQIVFLYFIQKKGWMGVDAIPVRMTEKEYSKAFYARGQKSKSIVSSVYLKQSDGTYKIVFEKLQELSDEDEEFLAGIVKGKPWGTGPKDFMRKMFEGCLESGKNYFDDYLEPLFYTGLNVNRGENGFYPALHRRIPFLNGGLFEQLDNYEWENNDFAIPNSIFSNADEKGREADGILDIFDRYNFTMNEDEPMEREVAIDPEMLGKVFENLLDVKDRKSKGAFYTPREIVHYMCQETLISHLTGKTGISEGAIRDFILYGEYMRDEDTIKTIKVSDANGKNHYEFDKEKDLLISEEILSFGGNVNRLKELDDLLANIKVADLAVGSGAFPLGMLNEIVKARQVLTEYMTIGMNGFEKKSFITYGRKPYDLKVNTIKNCIFACDIEPSAVDIAKLRLWLSIVIDDEITEDTGNGKFDVHTKPRQLPNLDCNIICGNSLIDEFKGIKLITESTLLNNVSENSQQTVFQSGVDAMISKLIEYQDKLFFTKNHDDKEELKGNIQQIYDDIILEQLQGNQELTDSYYALADESSKPFILWQLYFPRVFKENGGFDAVIGNPPYIGFHNVPDKDYYKTRYFSANGKYDFYVLFMEKGLQLLREDGMESFICPSYFYKRNYGKNIRKLLLDETDIKFIADFKDFQIFNSALTYTCIYGVQKSKKVSNNIRILGTSLEHSLAYIVKQSTLSEPNWNLERCEDNTLLAKIMEFSMGKFGEITKSISQGIVTGFNDIYLLSEALIAERKIETNYLEPVYKGMDIRNGKLIDRGNYVFYPYIESDKGKNIPIEEDTLRHNCPNLYTYLTEHKKELMGREYFAKSSKKWFELWNCRKKSHFLNRKFVFAEIGLKNDFVLADKCFYTDSACGSELKSEFEKYYNYLLLYLNSDVMTYIYKKISVPKANGYSIYKNAFLKELPIILCDEDDITIFNTMLQKDFNVYIRKKLSVTQEEENQIRKMFISLEEEKNV